METNERVACRGSGVYLWRFMILAYLTWFHELRAIPNHGRPIVFYLLSCIWTWVWIYGLWMYQMNFTHGLLYFIVAMHQRSMLSSDHRARHIFGNEELWHSLYLLVLNWFIDRMTIFCLDLSVKSLCSVNLKHEGIWTHSFLDRYREAV